MNDQNNTDAEKAAKLAAAGKKAEAQKKEKQERTVKGSHLLSKLEQMAGDAALGLKRDETNGFLVITGAAGKGKRVLIGKKGGRVDLSGFTIQADAIRQVSEQEARDKHLGKVRAQIDFNKTDEEILQVFATALAELNVALPEPEKKAKAPKTEAASENAAEAKVS